LKCNTVRLKSGFDSGIWMRASFFLLLFGFWRNFSDVASGESEGISPFYHSEYDVMDFCFFLSQKEKDSTRRLLALRYTPPPLSPAHDLTIK